MQSVLTHNMNVGHESGGDMYLDYLTVWNTTQVRWSILDGLYKEPNLDAGTSSPRKARHSYIYLETNSI